LLENVSGMAKNQFIMQMGSEKFASGEAVSVSNMDGETMVVTQNHVFFINPVEAE
jgi:hypothetical protein